MSEPWIDRDWRRLRVGDLVRWEGPDGGILAGRIRCANTRPSVGGREAVVYLDDGPDGHPTVRSVPWGDLWRPGDDDD